MLTKARESFVSLAVTATVLAGCSDMSTPADLDREQILGVRATPSSLVSGGSVELDTLLAGPSGPFLGDVSWKLMNGDEDVRLSSAEDGGRTTLYYEGARDDTPSIELLITVVLEDGRTLLAQKSVPVEAEVYRNPRIDALRVANVEVEDLGVATVQRGDVALDVDVAVDTSVSWYSSIGKVRYYRDANTILELAEEDASEGWLAVVVRDGLGGVTWHRCEIHVDE